MLYVRMVFIMLVSLYTSRIVLNTLGVVDYGIYNVVGGVVAMLVTLNGALTGTSSRFITYAIGKGDFTQLRKTFNSCVTIHLIISGVILLITETAGLWFVMNKLVIPSDRMAAAMWVYQCSVLSMSVSIVTAPYNALIIAHERMSAFALVSVFEATAKLGAVVSIAWFLYDKLIVYAILILVIQIIIMLLYFFYCKRKFKEAKRNKLCWEKKLSREMLSYAGWSIGGYLSIIAYTQGINILLNLFFGPVVNAARAIAIQVQNAVMQFYQNFLMAVVPQITKSYAQNDFEYLHTLIIYSSKFAFFLQLIIAFPIFLQADYILKLWLGIVPDYTVSFVRIMLLVCIVYTLSFPLVKAIYATGNIRKYQTLETAILVSVVPIAYVALKFAHISPVGVFAIYLGIEVIAQIVRVLIICPRIKMEVKRYFWDIVMPVVKTLFCVLLLGVAYFQISYRHTFSGFVMVTAISLFACGLVIVVAGLNRKERRFVAEKIKNRIPGFQRKHDERS